MKNFDVNKYNILDQKYYMKDVMSRLGITRDAIKYYEECGLIESKRERNGYRYFDYISMKKIERIQEYRSLRFSVDIIKQFMSSDVDIECERKIYDQQIQMLQNKIEALKYIKEFSTTYGEYYMQCKKYDGFKICEGCKLTDSINRNDKKEIRILYFDDDWNIVDEEYHYDMVSKLTIDVLDSCKTCERKRFTMGSAIRSCLKMSEMEHFQELFQKMRTFADENGYLIEKKAFLLHQFYVTGNEGKTEEGTALDIYIPIVE